MKVFYAIAARPQAGAGSSMDSRKVGPFLDRSEAERCATALASDPRCYGTIRVIVEDEDDDS